MTAARLKAASRGRLRDLEMVTLRVISFVPVHSIRIWALRAWGLSVSPTAVIYHGFVVRRARNITIGDRSIIGDGAILDGRGGLTIGSDVNFSTDVHVWTAQHDWRSPEFGYQVAPVSIGDRAWISTRVTILPGSTIGEGAVVAAGAVVSGEIPGWTLVGGVPARRIGDRPKGMQYQFGGRRRKAWWW